MDRDNEIVVCFCEDITEAEILEAIDEGYTEPKEIKLHLRAGMGECQGRGCKIQIMQLICQRTGKRPEDILPLTVRPPINPTPIGVLANIAKQEKPKR